MRNSVGVRSAVAPRQDAAWVAGSSRKSPDLDGEIAARALHQRVESGDELREGERLGEVVVPAGREACEAVGERIAGRQEDDRCSRPSRPEGLNEITAVRVG